MRRQAPILLLALAGQSCTCLDLPEPVLSSVDPPAAPNAVATALTVLGANFFADLTVDFDHPDQSTVNAAFALELFHPDGRRFPLSGVTLISDGELLATLPAGASPHTYEPVPSDIRRASEAAALFFVSTSLDGWAARLPARRRVEVGGRVGVDDGLLVTADLAEIRARAAGEAPPLWRRDIRTDLHTARLQLIRYGEMKNVLLLEVCQPCFTHS